MRTLHLGLRVGELPRSLAFYAALGFEVVGEVPETGIGHLTMLKLPGDEFVSLELVHDPTTPIERGNGLSHLVVQVESMTDARERLAAAGIHAEPGIDDDGGMWTATVTDPDGHHLEIVQWPPGHPEGMTGSDFAPPTS